MSLKDFFDEALVKGETLKEELLTEMMKSKALKDFVKSDLFVKAVSTVLKTKDEVTHIIKDNVKGALRIMDVPSRNDVDKLGRKLDQIEKMVDRAGRRAITVRSLKKIKKRKAATKRRAAKRGKK